MLKLVYSFLEIVKCVVNICRDAYTRYLWTHTQVGCLVLIVIDLLASENLQSQLCSTGVSLCWHGDLCCWHVLKMEAWLSSGLVLRTCLLLLSLVCSTKRRLLCWPCSVALEVQGYLTLRCSLKLAPRVHNIRASFCPLLSLEQGEYIGLFVNLNFNNSLKLTN